MSSENPYLLTVDGFPTDCFRVESFRGRESLSGAYSFDIETVADTTSDVERAALGQRSVLTWTNGEAPRAFYGVIARVRVGRGPDHRAFRTHLRFVPRLWLLKRKRKTRIFQKMRVQDVVTAVLLDAGISARWQLMKIYPSHEYLTQYEETDYAFITRILAEAGIYFHFATSGPIDSATETWSKVAGVAGGVASQAVGSLVGSEAGELVGSAASASMPLVPGDTLICADDALFYPALGPSDAAALAASTAAALAPAVGEAIGDALGGAGAVAGAITGGAAAVASAAIAAFTSSSAPSFYYRDASGATISTRGTIRRFDVDTSLRANTSQYREFDPMRPLTKLESNALSTAPFTPSGLEVAGQVLTTAGSMASGVGGPVGDVAGAVAENAGTVTNVLGSLAGENPPPPLEVYEHHGRFLFPDWIFTQGEATTILRQKRRRVWIAKGESGASEFAIGQRFAVEEHPVARLDQTYVLTSIVHHGRSVPLADGRGWEVYRNEFECTPASVTYVPPRPKRRSVQVALTATVVGPESTEIHVDEMGRIKVQFHWDRDGKNDGNSSCWIRTMHAWAGAGWGAQFIPRVGMEVIVVFEGGDPDKPMVMGAVYNGIHPTPFPLPRSKTLSGIRTRSTPQGGEGYNELSFEDRTGAELLHMHAQKDLSATVNHDRQVRIGRDDLEEIRGNQRERVGNDKEETIAKDRSLTVGGADRETVAGDRTTSIDGTFSLRVKEGVGFMVGDGDVPRSIDFYSFGDCSIGAGKMVTVTSAKGISLRCGDTIVEITDEHVRIESKQISLAGKESIGMTGKGPSLRLGDEATVLAKTFEVISSKGSLKMGDQVEIDGQKILLNSPGLPKNEEDEKIEMETKPCKFRLKDPDFNPYAGKEFRLSAGGLSFEGTTDGDGWVDIEVPKTAEMANVVVFLGERPEGEKVYYRVVLDELPDASTVRGAAQRLRNLGYYDGALVDEIDADLAAAIKWFQHDHDLEPDGKLTSATIAKLKELHTC